MEFSRWQRVMLVLEEAVKRATWRARTRIGHGDLVVRDAGHVLGRWAFPVGGGEGGRAQGPVSWGGGVWEYRFDYTAIGDHKWSHCSSVGLHSLGIYVTVILHFLIAFYSPWPRPRKQAGSGTRECALKWNQWGI